MKIIYSNINSLRFSIFTISKTIFYIMKKI